MTQHHRPREYPRESTREQEQGRLLDEHEAINNRLRARIVELAAMVDALKDVNATQRTELAQAHADIDAATVLIQSLTSQLALCHRVAEDRRRQNLRHVQDAAGVPRANPL